MLVHFSSLPVKNLTLNWLSNFGPVTHLNLLKVGVVPGGRGLLPYKRLMGVCRWMGLHFHICIDYNGVAHFRIFWGKTVLHIYNN